MSKDRIFKIVFLNQGNVVELYARQVTQGNLFGFIEVEDLVFGGRTEMVVDPTEESLRSEFGQAKRLYLPMHAVFRIEEVEQEGVSRMRAITVKSDEGIVRVFPVPLFPPGGPRGK
ncbi:MAG TPA: DUF1820 family protein [Thermoanaerobaculia bacterium]|jgi:hypothetical protein|nr:DUF1820 family protein [Thermoanaerobaculia bacterium]